MQNFLNTYISRNSDFDGYWVFGLIENQLGGLYINLLEAGEQTSPTEITGFAAELARTRFKEQMVKAGMRTPGILEATLRVVQSPEATRGPAGNGHWCAGHNFTFHVRAISRRGRVLEMQATIFVAPHNPDIESRRAS